MATYRSPSLPRVQRAQAPNTTANPQRAANHCADERDARN